MDSGPSIQQLLTQTGGLFVIGVIVYFLTRWLSFKREPWTSPNPRQSALVALSVTALPMLFIIIIAIMMASKGGATEVDVERKHSLSSVINQLITYLILFSPVLIAMKVRNEPWKSSGVTKTNLGKSLLLGSLLGLIAIVTCTECLHGIAAGLNVSHIWAFLQFSIVGFGEEFGYRGYLQTRLIAWLGRWQGWLLASFLMAILHISGLVLVSGHNALTALLSSAMLIPISLLMGYIMLRTENVVAPAILHTFADWVGIFT
ncbi:MAG: CPBP family intramembrane metalloprotease [Anaerolineales bacterium]|nr:CPBP family intramembrane metalloprotease [Anaerolineales bacterium]